jgi:preprotein translocase subunit SecG
MTTVLLVIHLMIAAALVGVVLIQRSEGGALGIGGGGGSGGFMTGRGKANLLTRATAMLATGFFLTSLLLSILAGSGRPTSILDQLNKQGTTETGGSTTPGSATTGGTTPDAATGGGTTDGTSTSGGGSTTPGAPQSQ